MKFFYYLIGWVFILALYGVYNAITASYLYNFFGVQSVFYAYKIIELLIFIWFGHQFLKRATYEGKGLGKSIKETIQVPFKSIVR